MCCNACTVYSPQFKVFNLRLVFGIVFEHASYYKLTLILVLKEHLFKNEAVISGFVISVIRRYNTIYKTYRQDMRIV